MLSELDEIIRLICHHWSNSFEQRRCKSRPDSGSERRRGRQV